ncbi:MAG: NPCBM/NEW2 domain-containing protein [Paludibacter sp.]|nr:NPCBM/NEW2 domain-containing protein [Paludibacter sp.]
MKRKINFLFLFGLMCIISSAQTTSNFSQLWLNDLDVSKIETSWGFSKANKSINGNILSVGGQSYNKGIGTHAISKLLLNVNKTAVDFNALVGVDDEANNNASIEFYVLCDKKVVFHSGLMKKGDAAQKVHVNLSGVNKLALLVTAGNDGNDNDHADWLEAYIRYSGQTPSIITTPASKPYILTPKTPDSPRINGAKITGASPNKPFLYTIAATGKRPMQFKAKNLPKGLSLDSETGIITGKVAKSGNYEVKITAQNSFGKAQRTMTIVIGENKLALTPPMGWNSWNCWGLSVSQDKVKASADAMVSSGLINHGWTYINIDDGWEASERAADGEIQINEKFTDMRALSDYIHSLGLKMGIYTSPGKLTCGGYLGSLHHEEQDADTYNKWGIDYLKYDWCSYGNEFEKTDKSHHEYMKPYITMSEALSHQSRDIVHSLCQYGMDDVWKWGGQTGQLWRTTGDITDTWESMARIGFAQYDKAQYAQPGNWNDPDMLVIGHVGWGPSLHPTRLTPDEQYTHVSLWALLAAPLLIGGDMSQMDDFTLSLLTNDEVIAINQDVLGKQARRIIQKDGKEIWVKDLEDGAKAIGLFNVGESDNVSQLFNWDGKANKTSIEISWKDLNISGKYQIRDLWTQKDIKTENAVFETEVSYHGVVLIKITPIK